MSDPVFYYGSGNDMPETERLVCFCYQAVLAKSRHSITGFWAYPSDLRPFRKLFGKRAFDFEKAFYFQIVKIV
jgi:hypothetical protein